MGPFWMNAAPRQLTIGIHMGKSYGEKFKMKFQSGVGHYRDSLGILG